MRPFRNWFRTETDGIRSIKRSTARRQVSKRLKSNRQSGNFIHIMDDDMFNTVKMMFESGSDTDREMATDIVLKSKIEDKHLNYFVRKWAGHFYTPKKKI